MSEEDVRDGMLEAVANEPPLRFDPDELVATARRQVRRRALVAAGLATVAVAVAGVTVPVAFGRGAPGTPVAEQPATRTASPSTSPRVEWPPPGVTTPDYTVDDLKRRGRAMGEHLRGSLPAALPFASDFTFGEFGGEAEGEFYPEQTSINAAITFTVDDGRYSIVITSWARGTADAPAATCVEFERRADGVLFTQTEDVGRGVIETMFHYRDTGAMVSVAAYNYDMTGVTSSKYRSSLPVTHEQLARIATDPELEL